MAYNPNNPNGQATMANSAPVVIASDQSALPDNIKQLNGTTIDTNSGNKSAGTQRFVLATDQPALTNPLLTTINDGTTSASNLAGDTGQNAVLTAGNRKEVTFTTTSVQAVASTDVSNYKYVSVQVTSSGTGSNATFQVSNDNTTWTTLTLASTITSSTFTGTASSTGLWHGPLAYRYFRINVTGISSGTTAGTIELFSVAPPSLAVAINSGGSNTVIVQGSSGYSDSQNPGNTELYTIASSSLYNGSTQDRQRSNWNTTTGDTGAKTVTFNGATQTNYNHNFALVTVLCGTVSGTTPTLSAQLQWSPDAGTTWINYGPVSGNATATGNTITLMVGPSNFTTAGATPSALTLGSTQSVFINGPMPRTWRLAYTIAGTTPSFAITGVYVNYMGI